jgi:hypothetical protein
MKYFFHNEADKNNDYDNDASHYDEFHDYFFLFNSLAGE